jgi:hypothetical protein
MVGLGIEFRREPLDLVAGHALLRALEAHADHEIIEPLDHRPAPRSYGPGTSVHGCKKRRNPIATGSSSLSASGLPLNVAAALPWRAGCAKLPFG